jgi:hypothetical protein
MERGRERERDIEDQDERMKRSSDRERLYIVILGGRSPLT